MSPKRRVFIPLLPVLKLIHCCDVYNPVSRCTLHLEGSKSLSGEPILLISIWGSLPMRKLHVGWFFSSKALLHSSLVITTFLNFWHCALEHDDHHSHTVIQPRSHGRTETLRTRLRDVLFNERIATSIDKMGYGFATFPWLPPKLQRADWHTICLIAKSVFFNVVNRKRKL